MKEYKYPIRMNVGKMRQRLIKNKTLFAENKIKTEAALKDGNHTINIKEVC